MRVLCPGGKACECSELCEDGNGRLRLACKGALERLISEMKKIEIKKSNLYLAEADNEQTIQLYTV